MNHHWMTDASQGEVVNAFGIGSRPLWLTMALYALSYIVVTGYAGSEITEFASWAGLAGGFLLFVAGGLLILLVPGDPLPAASTLAVAVLSVAGTAVSLFSLPSPPTNVMQTGAPIGTSVILLAFLAVRGRPLAAWLASGVISGAAAVWGQIAPLGAAWGVSITLPGYAIMIMGSLFSVMLRPMARQIYALREANARQAALDAASDAAAEVRDMRLAALDERARPILTRIAERREFTDQEVTIARLLEAQLRDGIRASGLDDPAVRDAAWRARERGVSVVLLDDGGLSDMPDERATVVGERLAGVVVRLLDETNEGRVTVRIQPPGGEVLATVSVDAPERVDRVEFGAEELSLSRPVGTVAHQG